MLEWGSTDIQSIALNLFILIKALLHKVILKIKLLNMPTTQDKSKTKVKAKT